MITKENAMQIYNLYSQIEKCNEIINILSECKDRYEKDFNGVDIIPNDWRGHQSIELAVPEKFLHPEASSFSGSRIYHISVPDAILVLENQVVRLTKSLEKEQEKAMEK